MLATKMHVPAPDEQHPPDANDARRSQVFTEAEWKILAMAKYISEKAVALDADRTLLTQQQASSTKAWQQIQARGQHDQAELLSKQVQVEYKEAQITSEKQRVESQRKQDVE